MKIKTLLFTALVLMAACDDSEYNLENIVPDEYHKILYVKDSGKQQVTLYDVEDDYIHTLSIIQAGSDPNQTAKANIRVLSQAEVDTKYSEPEAVNYKVLAQEAYTLGDTEVNFSVSDRYKLVKIALKPQTIKGIMESDPTATWVLPLEVISETDSINSKKNELFMQLTGVVSPSLGFTDPTFKIKEYGYGSVSAFTEKIEISLDVDNKWDLEWDLSIDEAYVTSYNTANGTSFRLLPAEVYTLPEGNKMSIAPGTTSSKLEIPVKGAELQPGDYLLPVRISNISMFEISSSKELYPLAIRILGKKLDRSSWTAEANTEEPNGEGANNGVARCILDDNLSTYWHSQWQGGSIAPPHELIVDAGKEYTFSQFGMVQRQDPNNKDTKAGEFYISSDKQNWTKVGNFAMKQIYEAQTFGITPTKGRYFKIKITESYRHPYTALSEVYVYGVE